MIDGKRVLGLVTARGGSKGLPGKNVRDLCGKPLIAWTIEAGLHSDAIDDLVLSTDSEEIAEVGQRHGAEVPFRRPAELASDTASSIDVVIHALDWLRGQGRDYELLVLLEPTSPLREARDIDAALRQMLDHGATAIAGVCRADTVHPAFMFRKALAGRLVPYLTHSADAVRRQEVEPLFYLEGTVYASTVPAVRERRGFYHDDTIGYEVPKWKAPEIDDIVDFLFVEAIMKHRGLHRRGTA